VGGFKIQFNLKFKIIMLFFIFRSLALDLIIGNPCLCMTELLVRCVSYKTT